MKSYLFASLLLLPSVMDAQGIIRDDFTGVSSIQLSTGSGDAIVVRGTGSNVSLVIEYTYSDEVFKPKIRQSGDQLILEEKIDGSWMSGRGKSTWTLTIPDGLDIRFSTGSGDMTIRDIRGDVRHASGSGDLELISFTGSIRSATGSGSLDAHDINGTITIATGSGDVDVDGLNGAISASTGSGDVSVEDLVATGNIKVATGSGDIDLDLSANPSGDISLASGSGSSTMNMNGFAMMGEWRFQTSLTRGSVSAPFDFDSTREVNSGGNRYREYTKVFDSSRQTVKISTGSGDIVILE